jgi:hypothetical protein
VWLSLSEHAGGIPQRVHELLVLLEHRLQAMHCMPANPPVVDDGNVRRKHTFGQTACMVLRFICIHMKHIRKGCCFWKTCPRRGSLWTLLEALEATVNEAFSKKNKQMTIGNLETWGDPRHKNRILQHKNVSLCNACRPCMCWHIPHEAALSHDVDFESADRRL